MSSDEGWRVALRGRIGRLELDVELESDSGSLVLVGPNGAGKTTLLRQIAGARIGLQGRVVLNGRTLMDSDRGIELPPEHRAVGYVPQGFALFEHMSVLDNVAFGSGKGSYAKDQARAWLERLDAAHLAARRPATLSGGEAQQVALARVLAAQPRGLLLDEPLSSLDIGNRRRTRARLVERLAEASIPTIVVTHDPADVLALGGSVTVLESGRVAQQGSAHELAKNPKTEFVAEFFELLHPGAPKSGSLPP